MAEERCLGELLGGGPLAGVHAQARGHEAHRVLTPATRVRYVDIFLLIHQSSVRQGKDILICYTWQVSQEKAYISEKNMLDVYDEEEDGAQISEKMMMKTDK